MLSHPEYDAFLRAILDNPDDDVTRWIAADWCSDRGYEAEAECLRKDKPRRIPVDEMTVKACELLPTLNHGQFVRDVCTGVRLFGTELIQPIEAGPPDSTAYLDAFFAIAEHGDKDRLSPKQLFWVWKLLLQYRSRVQDMNLVERARVVLPERIVREVDPLSLTASLFP